MKVLIADDEKLIAYNIERTLKKNLIECNVVHNGDDAIKELSTNTYDVCLLDFDMPGKNGLQVLEAKRKLGIDTKIIMISAYNDIDVLEEAEKDINLYISKTDLDFAALPSFIKILKLSKSIKNLAV